MLSGIFDPFYIDVSFRHCFADKCLRFKSFFPEMPSDGERKVLREQVAEVGGGSIICSLM